MSAGVPPSGVVTFLFTDIEGSTRRWESDADAMRSALVVHDKVLRTAIEAHDGFLFSHTGDGAAAAFASPVSAVNAAIDAQGELQLPVRMGIATGEAELRDGDYFGTVLNRASRVMAAGHGGQILLGESTAGLLSGVDLLDLGPQRLRDLPNPITLFQVKAPGLPVDFPPLHTLDSSPGNLRRADTSFIGRDAEAAEIAATVRAHHIVTLTGVGGVGKTRLALEVGKRLADEFPDGVWLFELGAVTDPAAVPEAVAAVLGIAEQPGETVTESVAAALDGRAQLLVFDNCEHVLGAAADMIEAIVARSTTVRTLATSREGLGAVDEQLWPVSTLEVARGIASSAAGLFLDRARSVVPHFSIGKADEASIVEICRRLDGIPLAIELAASRMASMTAAEMRDRLDHRFRLLVGSRRGLARHHTLRHAVAWSYDLLDDAEKALLDRCSVFTGGFDLQSACAVAGSDDIDEYAVLDLLDALVRKSLLIAERSTGRTRFALLETIRQFAEERLVARGEAEAVRTAHARYFAAREADIMALWDSPRQREAYAWFNVELANLRTAFRWAADQNDLDVGIAIATYASTLGVQNENYEPVAWAEELVAPARTAHHPRLATLYGMAVLCYAAGRVEDAVRYADAGRIAIDSAEFDDVPYGMEGVLGSAYSVVGQPERSVEWCRAQLAHDRDSHGITAGNLALSLMWADQADAARTVAEGLVGPAEATDNPWALSFALFCYGYVFSEAEPTRALDALRRGMVVARDSGGRYNIAILLAALSRLEPQYGEPLAALEHITMAIRTYHDSGNSQGIRTVLAILATHFDRLGRYEPAATIAGFAISPLTTAGLPEFTTAIAHLREVLGDHGYESLAGGGEAMRTAEMAAYALDQIDQARVALVQR